MQYFSLLLQVATLGLVAYLLVQFKALFREVRTPVVRNKGQMPADFRDRLRTMPRPGVDAPKDRNENRDNRDNRGDRGENRDRNRDNRGERGENRDRNRDNRGERGENRDRNRDNRGDRNRDDRGPRAPRPEANSEAVSEAPAAAPATESAPAAAPSFGGRRPLGPAHSSSEVAASEAPVADALAPASLAQPVTSDAPIRHGRRALPKAKPRFDDEPETSSEA